MNLQPLSTKPQATGLQASGSSPMKLNMTSVMDDVDRALTGCTFESLEARQLLSTSPDGVNPWAPYASIIGQDQAVAQYPFLNGTTVRVAVIDRGIDYNFAPLGGGIGPSKTVLTGVNFRDNSGI